MSIGSGIVGNQSVNPHKAFDKGFDGIKAIMGKKLCDGKINSLFVKPLSITISKVKLKGKAVPVDSNLIIQTMSL